MTRHCEVDHVGHVTLQGSLDHVGPKTVRLVQNKIWLQVKIWPRKLREQRGAPEKHKRLD